MKTTRHFLTNSLLAAVLAVAGVASRANATPADDAAAVNKKLEQESVKADLAGDLSFVKSHFADDASLGTSFGEWDSKEGMLKDMADKQNNKVNNEENHGPEGPRVRQHRDRDVPIHVRHGRPRRAPRANGHRDRHVDQAEGRVEARGPRTRPKRRSSPGEGSRRGFTAPRTPDPPRRAGVEEFFCPVDEA